MSHFKWQEKSLAPGVPARDRAWHDEMVRVHNSRVKAARKTIERHWPQGKWSSPIAMFASDEELLSLRGFGRKRLLAWRFHSSGKRAAGGCLCCDGKGFVRGRKSTAISYDSKRCPECAGVGVSELPRISAEVRLAALQEFTLSSFYRDAQPILRDTIEDILYELKQSQKIKNALGGK